MQEIINTTGIHTADYISSALDQITNVRFITKCRAGFLTISEARSFDIERYNQYPESLITDYKKGALQTVEVEFGNSGIYLTVFARVGKKVHLIEKSILASLTVGTINQLYYNTNLYGQFQYNAVNATSWASKAYCMNQPESQLEAA